MNSFCKDLSTSDVDTNEIRMFVSKTRFRAELYSGVLIRKRVTAEFFVRRRNAMPKARIPVSAVAQGLAV